MPAHSSRRVDLRPASTGQATTTPLPSWTPMVSPSSAAPSSTPAPGWARWSRRCSAPTSTRSASNARMAPCVDALLEAGFTVFVIAPNQLKNLRSRYGSAGNKDDRFDAYVLADTVRTDRHRLTALTQDSPQTITLRMTVRARKDLIAARVATANQLRAHLQSTLPGAIGLFRDIDSPITLAFLTRFPSQAKADWLSPARLQAWLRSAGYYNPTNAAALHAHLTAAPRGSTGPEAAARAAVTLALVTALSAIRAQIKALEDQITAQLAAHPDGHIFTSLPRAGTVRAARLLAEIGDARGRYPTPESLVCLAGAAPSTRQSGKVKVVSFRWAVDKQLRGAVTDFAGDSHTANAWAEDLYRRARDRGHDHPPRRPHPRPRLAARHLALLARPSPLRPRQPPSPATPPGGRGLTQGYSCR